jgi:hypothetical protein
MLVWIVLTLFAAAVLHLGITWLLRRLGIAPAAPELQANGLREVLVRVRGWTTERSNPH